MCDILLFGLGRYPIRAPAAVMSDGNVMQIPNTTKEPSMYHSRYLKVEPILIFIRWQATYRHMPTGGVTRPTPIMQVTRTPRTMGSTPTLMAMGNTMGMNRVSAAMDSMNIVTKKNRRRIIARMTVGLVLTPSMTPVSHLSKPAVVSRMV